MSKKKLYNPVPINDIPEVSAFENVRARYKAFREANPEFFQYLDQLAEEYNDTLQAAEKAVRSQEASSGEFELYQYQTKINAEEAYASLGEQEFLKAGGKISTVTKYEIDKARFESALKSGQIPADVKVRVVQKSPRYHAPKEIKLP